MENKKCKPGFRWCPISKKCKPIDKVKGQGQRQARGKGKGPMGQPKSIEEAFELVDFILTGKYSKQKQIKEIDTKTDKVLDEIENKISVGPEKDEELKKIHSDIVDELTKDNVSELDQDIAISISKMIREEEYREFFKSMMQQYNISSPSELDDEKKREFFTSIKNNWAKKKNQ